MPRMAVLVEPQVEKEDEMAKALTREWREHKRDLWKQAKIDIAIGGWYLLIMSLFNHGSLSVVGAGLIGLFFGFLLFPGLLGWHFGQPYTKHVGKRAWKLEKEIRAENEKVDMVKLEKWLADLRHDGE